MQIWVDADACPGELKELLFRAAKRTKIRITLVANQFIPWGQITPPNRNMQSWRDLRTSGEHIFG